jgi:hypothetical protein
VRAHRLWPRALNSQRITPSISDCSWAHRFVPSSPLQSRGHRGGAMRRETKSGQEGCNSQALKFSQ